ncbi:MAG: hypothetical protein QG635_2427 [Bacteroidota bacterium]|nr:hypothetical protein [Bacteroidota bacterium]
MKILAYLSLIILAAFAIYSCNDSLGVEDNVRITSECYAALPTTIGSYWIYATMESDSLGNMVNSNEDSMVVTRHYNYHDSTGDKDAYIFSVYRNGSLLGELNIAKHDKGIKILSKIYEPLVDTMFYQCFCGLEEDWHSIYYCDRNRFSYQSNSNGNDEMATIMDGSEPKIIVYKTSWRNNVYGSYNSIDGDNIKIKIADTLRLMINNPANVEFIQREDYQYEDNNRTVIAYTMDLNITFKKNTGITGFVAVSKSGKQIRVRTMNLLRYNIL